MACSALWLRMPRPELRLQRLEGFFAFVAIAWLLVENGPQAVECRTHRHVVAVGGQTGVIARVAAPRVVIDAADARVLVDDALLARVRIADQ